MRKFVNALKGSLWLKSSLLALLAFVPLLIGHGCGGNFELQGDLSSSSVVMSRELTTEFIPLEKTKTASLAYSKQVLDNMVSCLGLEKPSTDTEMEWQERKGNLSEFGFATEITGPMMMAVVAIAGEACSDLIAKERNASLDQRRIFKEVDFSNSGMAVDPRDLENISRRLTRSCWQREPTSAEVTELTSAVNEAIYQSASGRNDNLKAMLMMCTAVVSSLESIQI